MASSGSAARPASATPALCRRRPSTRRRRAALQVAVLSGNRNFPGRVHPQLEGGFLASPPLVIAFALAGDVERDILRDPIADGVHLADIWPTGAEIDEALSRAMDSRDFARAYKAAENSAMWADLDAPDTPLFPWDPQSTYIRRPPFATFRERETDHAIEATPILVLGDDVTTDHISPASQIQAKGETGAYLIERGENPTDLNVFSSRRGNWEAMLRGLFTNRTVVNLLGRDIPPGSTVTPNGEVLPLWRAAAQYRQTETPVVIIAGERYGMGSSRDWAAKGAALLGARAVLAASFERIHRSNLIGMGIVPLRMVSATPATLMLNVRDKIVVDLALSQLSPRSKVQVTIRRSSGEMVVIDCIAAIETTLEVETLRSGGIMPLILRRIVAANEEQ